MSSFSKIISNSTKHSGIESISCFQSENDIPILKEYGILSGGMAGIRAPYEMRRAGRSEKRHVCLWLILEGCVRFEIPGHVFTATPGMTLVMSSDVDRLCQVDSGLFRHIYFILDPESFIDNTVYDSEYGSEIESILAMILRENRESGENSERCKTHLSMLLADYIDRELHHSPSRLRLKQMFELIECQMNILWTTSTLASKLHMSPSLLYQLCKKQYGKSPGELISEIKFRHASELLRRTDDSIESISNAIGYGNGFAFSKAYYQFTGRRPKTLRTGK